MSYIRVKDKSTKHEMSIHAEASLEGWEVVDKPAMRADGTPLPPKHYVATKSLSSETPSGPKADNKKEA